MAELIITIQSLLTITFTMVLFIGPAAALTESLVQQCDDAQVRFSATNGSTQEISCCMENPSQCRWVTEADHLQEVDANYREEQVGLVLSWRPGIDSFTRYDCLNQVMNNTEEEVNFLPMEGNCPLCMTVTACATSTEIRLYTTIWISESLIRSPCQLYRNGELFRNVELDKCVQLQQEEVDFDMDNLTFICLVCDGPYRMQYDIPKTSLINASICEMDDTCVTVTPNQTRTTSSTESLAESFGTMSTSAVTLTTISSTIPLFTSDGSTNGDSQVGLVAAVAGVGGALIVIILIIITLFAIRCYGKACTKSTPIPPIEDWFHTEMDKRQSTAPSGNWLHAELNQRQPTGQSGYQEPGEVTNCIKPQAFIMYAKEEDDPQGDKIHNLSDLLIACGIDCTIDHYHANEIIPNWSVWVTNHITHHVTSEYGYVLLVCSETMIGLLQENSGTENNQIEMVYGHINQMTFNNILHGKNTSKFLPVLIDEDQQTCVPYCLQKTNIYRFPYRRLVNITNDTDYRSVLDLPECASLKRLVATLSGQKETPRPKFRNNHVTANHSPQLKPTTIDYITTDSPFDTSSQTSFIEDLQPDASKPVKEESKVGSEKQQLLN